LWEIRAFYAGMQFADGLSGGNDLMARFSLLLLVAACGASLIVACGPGAGTYCQSGPKYGTQCYSQMDLQPPGTPPPPAEDNRARH
jgi:hypothetical protein